MVEVIKEIEEVEKNLGITLHNAFEPKLKIGLVESYDKDKLFMILKNKESLKPLIRPEILAKRDPFIELKKFYEDSDKERYKLNVYAYKDQSRGRFHSTLDTSLQTMIREFRGTLTSEIYDDIDIVNARPTMLLYFCEKHGLKTPNIKHYVDNREQIVEEMKEKYGFLKDETKLFFYTIINGGSKPFNDLKNKTPFIKAFFLEMRKILKIVPKLYPNIYKLRIEAKGDNPNIGAQTLSRVLDMVENSALQLMVTYFKDKEVIYNNYVLMFDGFLIPKDLRTPYLLKGCEKYIYDNMKMKIKLLIKEPSDKLF